MSETIQINMVLKGDCPPEIAGILEKEGEAGVEKWARQEIFNLLEGEEELSTDWGAKILGIEIKRAG